MEEVLWRCRVLDTTALDQRLTGWRRGQGQGQGQRATRFQPEAELKDRRAAFPADAAIHSPVLQDVVARRDNGEKPGFPRFQGRTRSHSFTCKEDGNGAPLDTGFLVLATMGRSAARWSRPLGGTPKTVTGSKEADGW